MKKQTRIPRRIQTWFARNKRQLPWRHTRDPYLIWISEVMLQQTQVDTVIPYYERFIDRFPTLEALARASLQDVLKAWENMGYYARARNLHAAACRIAGQMHGRIPTTRHGLVGLPGIGTYIAGAILSIAYGQRVPAVDGNVRRVLSRLFGIQDPIDRAPGKGHIESVSAQLVPADDPGAFNQGIMELGALLCKPRNPSCASCPLNDLCEANLRGLHDRLPAKRKRPTIPHRHMTAGIISDKQGRMLIIRRPPSGLLGGLWKFPGGMCEPEEIPERALERTVYEEIRMKIRAGSRIASVKHAYTHFRITLHAFRCKPEHTKTVTIEHVPHTWIALNQLHVYPFSKADRKIIGVL